MKILNDQYAMARNFCMLFRSSARWALGRLFFDEIACVT